MMSNPSNGASWIADCLLQSAKLARAAGRLESGCPDGIRHFAELGLTVPLSRARAVEEQIIRLERESDRE
ncbi:MAG TPA: hypothetical protein VH183_02880 [Burkholderiaceae bacterium]|jgi:hypothetical protein|nr:hypothetical protein [Burkholderiaceae bacterium]